MIEKLNYDLLRDTSFMFGQKVLYDKINEIIDAINKLEIDEIMKRANELQEVKNDADMPLQEMHKTSRP